MMCVNEVSQRRNKRGGMKKKITAAKSNNKIPLTVV